MYRQNYGLHRPYIFATQILSSRKRYGSVFLMESILCQSEKIQQPLPLVVLGDASEVSPGLPQKSEQQGGTSKSPEEKREYLRKWRQEHRERCREYGRRDYRKRYDQIRAVRGTEEHKANLREYVRARRAAHPEIHKASLRRYRLNHPEYFREYSKHYAQRRRELYALHREEICAKARARSKTPGAKARVRLYNQRRRMEDIEFALAGRLRASMNRAFRRAWVKKPTRTEALLGCTIAEAKTHIESQFTNGMSWEHRKSFVIDHCVPVAAFDLRDSEEVKWAFNWRNLRPITSHENAVKSDKLPTPLPTWLPTHIAERVRQRAVKSAPPSHPTDAPS